MAKKKTAHKRAAAKSKRPSTSQPTPQASDSRSRIHTKPAPSSKVTPRSRRSSMDAPVRASRRRTDNPVRHPGATGSASGGGQDCPPYPAGVVKSDAGRPSSKLTTPDPTPQAAPRPRPQTRNEQAAAAYERQKERSRERQRDQTSHGQDIGPIPAVIDPVRRDSCKLDLHLFCLTYLPNSFGLAFSPAHFVAIRKMQVAIIRGELFALAMPRGSGKTALTIAAVLWALVYGHRHYALLVGATKMLAMTLLKTIKMRLQTSQELLDDFPELCVAIRAIGQTPQRAGGQKCCGQPTWISWSKESITFPTCTLQDGTTPESAGAVIECCGITGSIRGRQQPTADGGTRRPDLVIVDDPQTKASAKSKKQIDDRLGIIDQDILGLPGPDDSFAAFVLCTVIRPDDVADQLLNQDSHPLWQGERIKAVLQMPDDMAAWQEYWEVEAEGFRTGNKEAGNDHYRRKRKILDAGCQVYWPERFEKGEVSAIQHWMKLFLRSVDAFNAEAQQEPTPPLDSIDLRITAEDIILKQHSTPPNSAPAAANLVSTMMDVHPTLIYWKAVAWQKETGNGYITAHGTWPEQKVRHFRHTDSNLITLAMVYKGRGLEAAIKAGIRDCLKMLSLRKFKREDGAELSPDILLTDGGYKADLVKEAVATSNVKNAHVSFGRYYGAKATPLGERKKQPGVVRGTHWQSHDEKLKEVNRVVKCVTFDSNEWKTWVDARLDTSIDDIGSLSLPKLRPESHATLAAHYRAEKRTLVYCPENGRRVWEYEPRPGDPDNHQWDCLVGCAVGANMLGVKVPDGAAAMAEERSKMSVAERQKQRLLQQSGRPGSPPSQGGAGGGESRTPTAAASVPTPPAGKKLSVAERQKLRLEGR